MAHANELANAGAPSIATPTSVPLAAGCGSLATGGGEAEMRSMLEACWEGGIRLFDTAPLYGDSEAWLGRFLAELPRSEVRVSTKVGRLPALPGEPRRFAFRADDLRRSVERSLERLRVDRFDLLSVHDLAPAMLGDGYAAARRDLMDDGLGFLADLRGCGVVGSLGVATYDPVVARELLEKAGLDAVIVVAAQTLLVRTAGEALLPYCRTQGIEVVAAAPFHSGLLVTGAVAGARADYRAAAPALLETVARIERLCARHAVQLGAASIQFALREPAVSAVLAGHRTAAEVRTNLAWLSAPIPEAFWRDLEAMRRDQLQPLAGDC